MRVRFPRPEGTRLVGRVREGPNLQLTHEADTCDATILERPIAPQDARIQNFWISQTPIIISATPAMRGAFTGCCGTPSQPK